MQKHARKVLDPHPPRRKPHNYLRDLILILVCVAAVVLFFHNQTRFNFDSQEFKHKAEVERKVVYDGELNPENLGLSSGQLQPLESWLARELPHLRQIRIHIERQDRYAKLVDSSELRYWFVLTLTDGKIVNSVIARTRRDRLVANLVRRLTDDLAKYRDAASKIGKEHIDSFTNTM